MDADEAWVWLIGILIVWFVLGAALSDLLRDADADADGESVPRPRETLQDARAGISAVVVAKRGLNRQAPALPWRRCIRWPKARRRMNHPNRPHR